MNICKHLFMYRILHTHDFMYQRYVQYINRQLSVFYLYYNIYLKTFNLFILYLLNLC